MYHLVEFLRVASNILMLLMKKAVMVLKSARESESAMNSFLHELEILNYPNAFGQNDRFIKQQ